ncbi:MAG: class I SAM-dependent methyltransferase [Planctomycetota bacterium]|jgi:SAM-dependent methyltransferase
MTEWHEDDSFWEETAPVLFTGERLQKAATEVEQILGLVELPHGAAILDLACGQGRHALEFARRGYSVTGVDRTSGYIAEGQRKATEHNLDIEWVRADMRHFRRPGSFDAAVSLLTSFGYFEDPEEDRRVAENLFSSLRAGGRLVLDLMGKEVLARIYRQYDWHEEPDGTLLLEERQLMDDWSRLEARWIVIRGERRSEHRFTLRLYSAAELKTLLLDVGFREVNMYGSLAGSPYDHEAERLVAVCRRG